MNQINNTETLMNNGMKYLFEGTHYTFPVIEKGKGCKVWDVDGKEYYDLNAGQFCMAFGHGYEPFIECVSKQMQLIWHTNTATLTPVVFEAAEKLAKINDPILSKTMFLSTGSEANESAMRYAKFITGKNGIVSISRGYHGLTLASQAATFTGMWARPKVPLAFCVTAPDYIHSGHSVTEEEYIAYCINEVKTLFEKSNNEIAAFLMEPILGAGGMVDIPIRYMKAVRELCDKYGVLLIFDECQCGFGRTGEWFAYKRAGVVPDIITTAKAMGMGFAVSAVTFRDDIIKSVEGKVTNFSSHQNDPLSCAIVSFVIDEIERLNLLESNKEKGEYLLRILQQVCNQTKFLKNPRGIGLMCGFDLNDEIIENCRSFSNIFIQKLLNNGILIQSTRENKTYRIMPSYLISKEEIDQVGSIILKSINEM